MQNSRKWAIGLGLFASAVGAVWLALVCWLPTDEDLVLRLTAEAEDRLGVKVSIGSVHWQVLPIPSITINDFRTQQEPPVVIRKLGAYPNVGMLLQRKLVFERIDIDEATVPRNAVYALQSKPGGNGHGASDPVLLKRLVFRNLAWISYSGIAANYDGEIDFDPRWRPRHAELRRPGITPPFILSATREADADRWQTDISVGGGTAHGHVELQTTQDGTMHLSGRLAPRDIEVNSAMRAFNRRSPIAGKGSGQTVLRAEGRSLGELTLSLHTHTTFTVDAATVLRFDLDKAVSSGGKEYEGQTTLQVLTGQMDTQNGPQGMRVTGTGIRARAGKFTASGQGTVYQGKVDASGTLDLVEGAIGVPFTVRGPLQKPKVTVPPGFFAGAAIGTAVLPGIGTVIGARIGGALGQIFKGNPRPSAVRPLPDSGQ